MRNKKGASAVLGQVFIMIFGVLILITVVVAFSQLKDDTVEYSAESQYRAVAHQVNAMITSAQEHMNTADSGYLGFTIPEKIAGENYLVRFNTTHILVENFPNSMNQSVLLSQQNITVSGNISSDDVGKVRVYFNTTARNVTFTRV